MKKLNTSGIAHFAVLAVIVLGLAGFGTFKLVQRAQASQNVGHKVTCTLDAPDAIAEGAGFDVIAYFTNGTGKAYTPHPVLTAEFFDNSETATRLITADLGFQEIAASATATKNTVAGGQWKILAPSTKIVYTLRDVSSAASCTATVTLD
ncbi:MAG: hypothetical protein QFB87_01255 [Patescibacteria group bacterium]|nr:hypothetical protein [Patescibacteria group bacterium]